MNSIPTPTPSIHTKFNTPQILRTSLYGLWAVSFFWLLLSIVGVRSQRYALQTVGKDAAPSILTAQQLRDSFADLDASLANELLSKPGDNRQPLANFEINQKKIADRLVAAAKNITYPAEEQIVQTLQLKSSDYLLYLQSARDAHQRGDKIGALNIYRSAASLMDREILPQAEQLDRVNSQELESTYDRQSFSNGAIALIIAVIGLVQVILLAIVQIFLYRRMRRVLNLPLLGAMVISSILFIHTMNSILSATSNLKVAKQDAFNSIHNLRQARALSYMANADESRYLLDTADVDKHDRAFTAKIGKLITIPPGKSLTSIINSMPRSARERKFHLTGFTGFYAEQLNNITFDGELDATVDTLNKLDVYLKIDAEIRRLYRSGKVAEAIVLCTGTSQGQSNWAFEQYRAANEKVRLINEKYFAANIEAGFENLANFEIIACISIGTISVLILLGLRPRLAEYL